jgi:RHS repeat-associated protein
MRNRFVLAFVVFCLVVGGRGLLAQVPSPSPNENPEGNTGALKAQIQTAGSYDAHSGNATRIVNDLHVPGALGTYGLDFTRYWNSVHNDDQNRDADFPMDFGASGWSHSWKWTATFGTDVQQLAEGGGWPGRTLYYSSITITFPDGHANKYNVVRASVVFPGQDPYCVRPGTPWGPPYLPQCGETNWNDPGIVDDHLRDMAQDGSNFWLVRADGGSVHFIEEAGTYQAKEVYDPNGFRTDLHYNSYGDLDWVMQEGGRRLDITRGYLPGWGGVITQVTTGGPAGSQYVTYGYKSVQGIRVLAAVTYPNDLGPGQPAFAQYTYESPAQAGFSNAPVLREADDPHLAGPMTSIHYGYHEFACGSPGHYPPLNDPAAAKWNYFFARAEAIASESSSDHVDQTGQRVVVSQFGIGCYTGTRTETNGFGARRAFYFGNSANDAQNKGYELSKETDFTSEATFANVPFRHQTGGNHPDQIWDGYGHLTQIPSYTSGHPADVRYLDGSNCTYDWITPHGSEAPDTSRIHDTPYHHWLFQKKDERGQYTTYVRDSRRRIKRIEYPDGSSEGYTYNTFNQVETHTLPTGAIETYVYDGDQRLIQKYNSVDMAQPIPDYTEFTYDSLERVATMKEGLARQNGAQFTVQMTYNGRHQVTSVEYPSTGGASHPAVRYEYDWYGNCQAIIDELGHRKDYTYDAYRRCTSLTEQLNAPGWDCSGTVASRRWDWIYDRVIDGIGITFSAFSHTSNDWRLQIEPEFNADHERRGTSRTFDVNNRITSEQTGLVQLFNEALGTLHTVPDVTETHYFAYDQNGQKRSYKDPLGRVTTYDYDIRNRLWKSTEFPSPNIGGPSRMTETRYNAAGDKTMMIFPDGKFQEWPDSGYTAFGQPRVFIDERHNTTDLDYWHWGPMKKLSEVITHREPGGGGEAQHTRFYYDGMGRPQTTSFPDNISTEVSTYKFGQVATYKTRRGATKTISYDARGRETDHVWDDGMTSWLHRTWDDANRLVNISNNIATLGYTSDVAGQMLSETTSIAGSGGQTPSGSAVSKQLGYCRFPSGEVSKITYPNGSIAVNPTYTGRGQLAGVGWPAGSTSYVYLPDGKVGSQVRTNGVTTTYGYDGRGMISSLRHTKGDHDLAKREYWRDERDRITAWKRGLDQTLNPMEDGRGNRYQYDAEGELEIADYRALINPMTGEVTDPKRRDHFYYDALGNRMGTNQVASMGDANFTRRDNGLNQYLDWTPSAIYYDDNHPGPPPWVPPGNGVMMADGNITASFNALNQPMAIWSPVYNPNFLWFGFDPLGRCVKRWIGPLVGTPPNQHAPPPNTNPATYYYYDGWNLVQEGSSAFVADRSYVHGGRVDEIVASQDGAGGPWYHHHYDGQGNCIMLTTVNGGLQEQYDYDAFGFPYFYSATGGKVTAPPHTRFLFTGREWLRELRIYDYRARQYQPELGRFLQPDPKEFGAGDYILYRYCHNDPVNKSDPTGLKFTDEVETQEVSTIPGDRVGRTDALVEVVSVAQKDGSYRLRLDVTIVARYVAKMAHLHGRQVVRSKDQIDATHTHEEVEHHKDWEGFHDGKQGEIPNTRFPSKAAAEAVAKPLGEKLRREGREAKKQFEQHKPDSRWDALLRKEGL